MPLMRRVNKLSSDNLTVAFRPSQLYSSTTGAYTIFSIADGAVEIITLGGRITAAAGGATTVDVTVNGVAADAGAVAINGAVGTVVFIPVNVAGATLNAAAIPKTVATLTSMIAGTQPAGPGLIVATYAVSTATMELFCVYRKLSPNARIY